jgi:fructoselysine transporter
LANTLQRRLTLLHATAINMIDMVGIGPFVSLPIVISMMNGPHFLWAWVLGALLSLVDANVWSELGALYPQAGGTYNYLKNAFGEKWGKYMSFLFIWQTIFQAPLVIASAAIGFAGYCRYLLPSLGEYEKKMVSGLMVISIIVLLYRKIEHIGKISVLMWVGVLTTMAIIIGGGFVHGHFFEPVWHMTEGIQFNWAFFTALGYASTKTVYSYLGYYNVAFLGGEIVNPQKNIPKSMFISIIGISVLYLLMNISVVSVVPWQTAKSEEFVISIFMEQLAGKPMALLVTGLILCVAFSSAFSATLGYSRIPYAAAKDGAFFDVFAKLHPTKEFPHVSLLVIGGIAFLFSLLFKLSEVISAILAMRILVQFIGQSVGLLLLHKRQAPATFPYKMPFYPLPIVVAIIMWALLFLSTGKIMIWGLVAIATGTLVYVVKNRLGGGS